LAALTQILTDAEDQEQTVVGARAQDQHDQHQLGQLGHLQARLRGLADQRPGDGHGQERGDQRDQRRKQRPEDQQQQDQDEDHGQEFHLIPRGARLGLLVDVDGDVAGQGEAVSLPENRTAKPSSDMVRDHAVDQRGHPGARGRGLPGSLPGLGAR
jgi:hypothetical protein